jgi:hypothetical protein
MKTSLRLTLSVLSLGLPLLALAAPSNVTGITAAVDTEGVRVTWEKVGGDIANYRVFYSHASILNNAGLYDDFEEVSGTETSHVLRNIPQASDLYVAVLAVDMNGEESPYFTEEAHVALASGPEAPVSSVPVAMPSSVASADSMEPASSAPASVPATSSAPAMPQSDELRLLSVEVVSSTGVILHFSHTVTVDPARATEAVTIETASGTKLPMKRFTIQGKDVHVDTAEQERGIVYKVTVGTAISATGSAGQKLFVSPDDAPVLFSGHPTGKEPSSAPSSVAGTPDQRSEVTQLRLRAQPTGKTYRVEATWQPAAGDVKGYSVAQTTDGGKTFGSAKTVGPDGRDIIVSDVPGGSFGMRIRVIYTDDSVSKGTVQTIDLPRAGGTAGSVTGGGSTSLPNSGPALWLAIAAAGATAGFLQTRRKQPAAQVA